MDASAALSALMGGIVIGLGAALLLFLDGRLAAVSGIVSGAFLPMRGEWGWRAAFVVGLLAAGATFAALRPSVFPPASGPLPLLGLAGLIVGFGSRLGGGCTSGHGICGLSRFSRRSLIGTITFMLTGALTMALASLLGGAR